MVGIAVANRKRGPDPCVPPRVLSGREGGAASTTTTAKTATTDTAPADAANASTAADSASVTSSVGSSVDKVGVGVC